MIFPILKDGGGDGLDTLREWLYQIVVFIANVHDSVWAYCKSNALPFTDKDLHFIVIGAFGLLLFLLLIPPFILLTRRPRPGLLAWLFTFSGVLFVAFAIEVGQEMTGTGGMELEDIVYGVVGFLVASAGVWLLYFLYRLLRWLIRKIRGCLKNR